jgi:hypothetical protein
LIAETILLFLSLTGDPLADARAGMGRLMASAGLADPLFQPGLREVTNWRAETLQHLELDTSGLTRVLREPERLPRCVRLNNYWCIKSAGWRGEIASDTEGHVAFSSATEGAAVAALLLRRYYIDYGRHTALAIVSRWAPAQCGPAIALRTTKGSTKAADGLATRGLRNTLRARFLAGHTGRSKVTGAKARVHTVIASAPMAMLRAPAIVIGFGEKPSTTAPTRLASLTLSIALPPQARGGSSCPAESQRIRNYAARASAGVGSPETDLALFDATGAPTANLARVMRNMAAVEIGPMAADPALIEAGIARAVALWTPTPAPPSE